MRLLLTPRWIGLHTLAVTLTVACGLLAWWQVSRAAEGNLLSYGYAVLWPVFGGFVVLVWVREMRLALRGAPAPAPQQGPADGFGRPVVVEAAVIPATGTEAADDDPALVEYNRYLAWLAANPGVRPVDYPGTQPATSEESS